MALTVNRWMVNQELCWDLLSEGKDVVGGGNLSDEKLSFKENKVV